GDRDKTKRPVMAKVACEWSDKVILTSDNPRTEDPAQIIKDMEEGVDPAFKRHTLSIVDRREAIKTACMLAQPGDIILLAGKGHEKYQEINGVKNHFDDMEQLEEQFKHMV
ncbi:MAG: UDP-N-acetylmuramoyl-L-alanyl-D-glutamate--2,6-diaminopimelate ligase, partial [Mucilaginibacter sp.]|nr:UDP-N-acetylmuramoyl-L-alanyl-D-glutamate--2,6-diaminopimelate ligase [Mucilaginibacter sp.]